MAERRTVMVAARVTPAEHAAWQDKAAAGMHIKCLGRGRGSAWAAVDYLVGERDADGRRREGVEVLRGNPDMVAAVADSLDFERKYTSVVIAWAPADRGPDRSRPRRVRGDGVGGVGAGPLLVDAGLRGGGVHVHILAAQCDLETGRSLNIAPPGWQKTFDPLRDAFNHEHGWSRPDDPARARAQQPGHRAYIEASKLRAGLEHEADPRELIRDYLVQRVENGAVQSRADVVSALEEVGFEVPRQGKSHVTARDPDGGKRWRLKGALYGHDFQPERLDFPAAPPAGGRPAADRGDGRARARAARRDLERRRKRRVAFHRGRYGGGDRAGERPADARVAPALGDRPEPFLGFNGGSWATMQWLSRSIERRIETLATLNVQIEGARWTLAEVEERTWGVTLREIKGERFVVLPAGTLDNPPWTVGGRPAVKLSRE